VNSPEPSLLAPRCGDPRQAHDGSIFFPPGVIGNTVVPSRTLPEPLVTSGKTVIWQPFENRGARTCTVLRMGPTVPRSAAAQLVVPTRERGPGPVHGQPSGAVAMHVYAPSVYAPSLSSMQPASVTSNPDHGERPQRDRSGGDRRRLS